MSQTLYDFLTEGVSDKQWGYGLRRMSVTADKNTPEFYHQSPYSFTSMGHKDQGNQWQVCLRMNVEQDIPLKMRPMDKDTNIRGLWCEMMIEFGKEYAYDQKKKH
jgi:hypothetical protein